MTASRLASFVVLRLLIAGNIETGHFPCTYEIVNQNTFENAETTKCFEIATNCRYAGALALSNNRTHLLLCAPYYM